MKSIKQLTLFLAVCFVLTQMISAQKIWERDWQTWKEKDAYKVLNDSPWGKNCYKSDGSIPCRTLSAQSYEDKTRVAETPPVIVKFYSSLKIRQALWRLNQLRDGYDKMDSSQKEKYDEAAKSFFACDDCKKYYVITLFQSVVEESRRSIFRSKLKSEKLENIADKIYLANDKNEKRNLAAFSLPGREPYIMTLYFPILDHRQSPLVTDRTKKISLNFKMNLWEKGFLERAEFDVSKMLVNGKLDF